MTLRVGTRGSALALAQAGDIAREITERTGVPTELVPVTTHGDVSRESLSSLGGTGVFASALREFLLAGNCDLVVHSMKDLPTAAYPGLRIGAVPVRADARDTLCARDGLTLATLPAGSRVGTGSPRRAAQLASRRQDIEIVDIRGNVDTRLNFVSSGELDAVVLAAAGLGRLGRSERVTEYFDLDSWPTAPAQGALAIEVRDEEHSDDLARALASIQDEATHAAAVAERRILFRLEAGCAAPIGAHAVVENNSVTLHGAVYAPDGSGQLASTHSAVAGAPRTGAGEAEDFVSLSSASIIETAEAVGTALADELLARGAAALAPLKQD
ncbi:hydroxymethylbilane synthase [Okibacterium sp. HSC-33S16]|uniref:hydroxymethylbilane synthase n=1 Tax=Okibacterium sp. HSC-33S16 TaxID=2910965 RepID=UPI0027E3019F|nr:hydroxymethylbilane synthase [Okibacterium sp. HSC-33S16]MCP2032876.1 hydroxymethylbilane synthase [Okibacterium sp. HSC-33S16]